MGLRTERLGWGASRQSQCYIFFTGCVGDVRSLKSGCTADVEAEDFGRGIGWVIGVGGQMACA